MTLIQLSPVSTTHTLSILLAFGLGFSAFTPIGISYLILLCYFGLWVASPEWRTTRVPMPMVWRWLLILLIAWPAFTLVMNWHQDGGVRWLHSWRLAACVALAVTLTFRERMALLIGLFLGCTWALGVVWVHNHLYSLPNWSIWHQLLDVRGNASSQKWILMAGVAGTCMGLAICLKERHGLQRAALFVAGLAFAVTVANYSISRNAHLVVMALPFLLLAFRFRRPVWWAAGAALAVGLVWMLLTYAPTVNDRFEIMGEEIARFTSNGDFRGSVSVRAQMSITAWEQMWAHPWMGTGLGSWASIWADASQRHPELAGLNNPHNDYLLWGMETGVVGMLLLVLLLIKSGKDAWSNTHQPYSVAGWTLTWTLAIAAAVNAPFRDAALGMTLCLLAVAFSTWPIPSDRV